jgi:PAS domain S-box-containing protein
MPQHPPPPEGAAPFLHNPDRSRLLLESIRDYAVIVMAPDRTITDWNVGAERLFGYSREQAVGRPADMIFTQEDRAAGAPEHEARAAAEKGSYADERWHLRADNTRRFVAGRIQAIVENEKLTGFIKVVRDETQRRNALDQLIKAKSDAEVANAAKDQFLAVLSHELRNPLTPILATATMLLQNPHLPEEMRPDIITIQRNTQLEARLIDDLLDATRVGRGKVQLNLQKVMVETLIHHVVEICRGESKGKSLEINISFAAKNCCVHGDPARLQQILWNLLRNAIKFSPEGGTVTIETHNPQRGLLEVRVVDAGVGIAPENLERIFQPFEQVAPGKFGGLGLGLSISRGMAELHGGKVLAESPGIGKGATMRLLLPVLTDAPCFPDHVPPDIIPPSPRQLRVLIVEDNLDTARSLSRLVAMMGHKVATATSAAEALRLAQANLFDVMLSDIGLGDDSGLNLVRTLSARYPGLRSIAMSGYGSAEDMQRSRAAGFQEHLVKPLDLRVLERVLGRE